jgi:transposase
MHQLQELVRLHRLGTGAREVARLLVLSPTTERKYRRAIDAAGLLKGPVDELPALDALREAVAASEPKMPAAQERSSIESHGSRVRELMKKGLRPRAIYDRLRMEDADFTGSYAAVKRMVRRFVQADGVRAHQVAIPVQTEPGEVAQVDFGYVGKLMCPVTHVLRRAWVFIMVLGYSRHMYAEVVFDQKTETWLELHERAFMAFGGTPETIVPDNLKAAVIRAAFGVDSESALNRSYREAARYWGFKVDPAPPYAPKKKGKVESAVKYVKRNALAGREGEDIEAVNRVLARWVEEVAGQRRHGTTGRQPLIVFHEEESNALRPLPSTGYERIFWHQAKVHQDTHICFDGRLYSVPWRWVGHSVWVRATPSTVTIFAEDARIATHARRGANMRSTNEAHLPKYRGDLRHRSHKYWRERSARIGPDTERLIAEIFDSDAVLSQLRRVQAIVTHLEGFPVGRAEATSRRAVYYGMHSYQGIKKILADALDLQPLPDAASPTSQETSYRFARSPHEIFAGTREACDEPH